MVRVPTYTDQVTPSPLPGVRVPGPPPAEAFGASSGGLISQIILDEKRKADDTAVNQAVRTVLDERVRLMYDRQNGLDFKTGEELFEAVAPANDTLRRLADDTLEGLSASARQRAKPLVESELDEFRVQLGSHEARERARYNVSEMEFDVDAFVQAGINSANNTLLWREGKLDVSRDATNVDKIKGRLRSYAETNADQINMPVEKWLAKHTKAIVSAYRLGVIEKLLEDDETKKARAYMKLYRSDMTEEHEGVATGALKTAGDYDTISDAFESALELHPIDFGTPTGPLKRDPFRFGGKPPEQARKAIRDEIRSVASKEDWPPELRDRALEHADAQIDDRIRMHKAQQDELAGEMLEHLGALGGVTGVLQAQRSRDWDAIGAENRAALAKAGTSMRDQIEEADLEDAYRTLLNKTISDPEGVIRTDPRLAMAPFRGHEPWESRAQKLLDSTRDVNARAINAIGASHGGTLTNMKSRVLYQDAFDATIEGEGGPSRVTPARAREIATSLRGEYEISRGWLAFDQQGKRYRLRVEDIRDADIPSETRLLWAEEIGRRQQALGLAPLSPEDLMLELRRRYLHAIRTGQAAVP